MQCNEIQFNEIQCIEMQYKNNKENQKFSIKLKYIKKSNLKKIWVYEMKP